MEQLTMNSQPAGIFIRGGQTLLLKNKSQNLKLSACLNGDIIQQALNGLNANLSAQAHAVLEKNEIDNSFFISDKDIIEDDGTFNQLSISDDFPIHLLNSPRTEQNILNTDQQSFLLENILFSENDNQDNSFTLDNFPNILQLSPDDASNNQIFDISSSNIAKNVTYAYQLASGTKVNQFGQNGSLSVPITSADKLTTVFPQVKSTADNIQVANNVQGPGRIVFLSGVNHKPTVLLKLKNKTNEEKVVQNIQKLQTLPPKSFVIKNQRVIAPQRMALPPLKKIISKEIVLPKNLQTQEFKAKSPGSPILLSSLLSPKVQENRLAQTNNIIINSPIQIIQADANSPVQQKIQVPISQKDSVKQISNTTQSSKLSERLTEAQLKKISTAFQNGHLNVNQEDNFSTIYDSENNTKIVCRIVYPEELVEENESIPDKNYKKKVKKRLPLKKSSTGVSAEALKKQKLDENKADSVVAIKRKKSKSLPRTRSGRLSRPPRYMKKDFKKLNVDKLDFSCSDFESETEETNESEPDENIENAPFVPLLLGKEPNKQKLATYKCSTCGKTYPGKKMFLHLTKYPDHGDANMLFAIRDKVEKQEREKKEASEKIVWKKFLKGRYSNKLDPVLLKEVLKKCSDEVLFPAVKERFTKGTSPWDYLMQRHSSGIGTVRGLLTDLAEVVKSLPNNMLMKTEPTDPNAIHILDERLCALLNISPGSYLPNDSALKPDIVVDPLLEASWPTLMETDSISSKDEDCSNMKLGIVPLDLDKKESNELADLLGKSPLETVDEILNERLNDLMPLDVSSIVETNTLDRSIFSTNSLELQTVSASTEDLLKTLENLTPELPPVPVSTDFDFTVLTTDFGSDR